MWDKVIFLHLSVILFTGGCAWQGGMRGRDACMAGGHAWQGACMVRGCAWQEGVCVVGGHAWQGACMVGGHAWQGGGHVWQILRDKVDEHPTGMHSCLKMSLIASINLVIFNEVSRKVSTNK